MYIVPFSIRRKYAGLGFSEETQKIIEQTPRAEREKLPVRDSDLKRRRIRSISRKRSLAAPRD